MNLFSSLRKIPKSIWLISAINALLAISSSMTFSVSPFFITSTLGISVMAMGIIEGCAEGLAQISRLLTGVISDRLNKTKPSMIFAVLLTTLSKLLFILSKGTAPIIASKITERLSNGTFGTARDTYVGYLASPESRGLSFGLLLTGRTIGAVVGSFLIGALFFFSQDYQSLLWLSFIPSIIAFFLIFTVQDKRGQTSERIDSFRWGEVKNLPKSYWNFLLASSIFMLGRFSDGMIALRLKEMGASSFICLSTIGIFNMMSFLCCIPVGRLSDRFGRSTLLFFPFIGLVLFNLCFVLGNSIYLGILGTLLWGVQRGSSQLLFSSLVTDVAPKSILGTAIGFFYLISGLASLTAGVIGGTAASYSLKYCFIYSFVCSIIALTFLVFMQRNNRNIVYGK